MRQQKYHQKGATLIVALVILAVITLLGVASMRSSTLELRMANSMRERASAFQAAEAALLRIERLLELETNRFPITAFLPGCTSPAPAPGAGEDGADPVVNLSTLPASCFTQDCINGFCFTGTIASAQQKSDCSLAQGANVQQPWRLETNWAPDAGKSSVITVPLKMGAGAADDNTPGATTDVRYMVEFMCFVPREDGQPRGNTEDSSDYLPLYRVTVRAAGAAQRAAVMLQSTLVVPNAK